MTEIESIDDPRYLKALSHPLRVRILRALQDGEGSPVELARRLGAPLGTISYHVRTLVELGLLELARETRRRGAVQHHYRIVAPAQRAVPGGPLIARRLLRLDKPGYRELEQACAALVERAAAIERAAQARLERESEASVVHVGLGLQLVEAPARPRS